MALRTLPLAALGAVTVLACDVPVQAQSVEQAQTKSFNIPADDLILAFRKFQRQSGGQVRYALEGVVGQQTQGVSGQLPPHLALVRLLEGTGLTFMHDGAGTYFIAPLGMVKTPGGRCRRDPKIRWMCTAL